ncbi:hypothetical protein MMC30_000385 [Trapelia coarctata]|nr:hypothetical protein [Trapelia coarctata]
MDPPASTKTGVTSNLPRLSKLPQPGRSVRSSSKTDGSTSTHPLSIASSNHSFGLPSSVSGFSSISANPSKPASGDYTEVEKPAKEGSKAKVNGTSSAPVDSQDAALGSASSAGDSPTSSTTTAEGQIKPEGRSLRRPRPSLSDRTVETLSQIPPSPSPRRRQSGFYGNESPMRPPSRAASAMNYSRPGSRAGTSFTPIHPGERAPSPSKSQSIANAAGSSVSTTPGRRAVSTCLPRNSVDLSKIAQQSSISRTPSKLQRPKPANVDSTPTGQTRKPLQGSKTMSLKSPSKRAPLQTLFGEGEPEFPKGQHNPSNMRPTVPAVSGSGTTRSIPQKSGIKRPLAPKTVPKCVDTAQPAKFTGPETDDTRSVSASSQTLRQTIAKAKAAAQKGKLGPSSSCVIPRSAEGDQIVGTAVDPFALDLLDSSTNNILRQRVNSARTDGKLNIAVLGLAEIPKEVMTMYDYDPNSAGSVAWYETVDLVRLNAADNDIAELPDYVFPDIPEPHTEPKGIIFGGLETIDLHGNQLRSVPPRLGNMPRLTHLNLSRNQLSNEAVIIISRISSLTELRLAENALRGPFPECLSELANLELLDIHENAISDLPTGMERLSKLKSLNIAGNKIASLPFEAMTKLPLVEIIASRNRLEGSLLPPTLESFPALRSIDVSHNALLSIMTTQVGLPSLQSLDVSNNRITILPASAVWPDLVTLTANQNQISIMPADFPLLEKIKTVDLCGNNLTSIDNDIGLMESLTALRLDLNPFRDRKLLKMGTEDLKTILRDRLTASKSPPLNGTHWVPESASSLWTVNGGVLDKSRSKLRAMEYGDLETVAMNNEVKSLVLHHNMLQQISPAISAFAGTLVTLDLSHNKLGQNMNYIEPLSLPNLQTLNLTSNALTSLEPLTDNLSAPSLTTLILPFNRLTSFPPLCAAFPALSTLLASNNKITNLDVDAVRGVQTLDVSSNEIEHLPAQLALLQGQLRTLMVTGNKFRVPGWGVLEKGTEEILKWCRMKLPIGEEKPAALDEVD